MTDNAFAGYFPESPTPGQQPPASPRPQGKRRRKRRREAEPQTIGTNPETWPPPEPEIFEQGDDLEPDYPTPAYTPPEPTGAELVDDGFTGDWNDWTEAPADEPAPRQRGDDVDWNDWATATATEQSGDYVATPTLLRLTDYGGGGKISRRPRRNYDDERYDGEGKGRSRVLAAAAGVAGAIGLLTVIGLVSTVLGADDPAPAAAGGASTKASPVTTSTTPPLPAWGLTGCEEYRSATITISAERGDTATPQGAILGFEHAYFVARDAAKVRSYVTDDAHVGDQAALAEGVAALPNGVRYCVHITRGSASDTALWNVDVRQQWPTDEIAEKMSYAIRTTEVSPGVHKITSITYR